MADVVHKMVIECRKQGCDYFKISKQLHIAIRTIGTIVHKWKKHNTTADLHWIAPPPNIVTFAKWIAQTVQKNPFIPRSEFRHGHQQAGTEVSKKTIHRKEPSPCRSRHMISKENYINM